MTNIAFAIGNGESRQPIDLESLQGLTVGCNALVRDYSPDILSAADQQMVTEILASEYGGILYTRPDWNTKFKIQSYPKLPYHGTERADNPWHWNSGPHAINIACCYKNYKWSMKTAEVCFLIGFDMTQTKLCNNIYKNTIGYNNQVVDPKYWHYQINKLYEHYATVRFVWVAPNTYTCPDNWKNNTNFLRIDVDEFNYALNNNQLHTYVDA